MFRLAKSGLGKAKIKLLFGTEQAYEKYVETLTLVDGVQQREAVAEKFRHQLFERFPKLESALSDEIFDAEMEELALKREVSRLHLGNTRAERIAVDSMDEKVAMLAAGSMQPVLCSLIQAALKKRTARKGTADFAYYYCFKCVRAPTTLLITAALLILYYLYY